MNTPPQTGVRYDEYEPRKYNCISVNDEDIETLCVNTADIPVFYHTLDLPQYNLNYTGITLIPPQTATLFADRIGDNKNLQPLKALFEKAARDNKFVIHYGL